MQAYKLDAFQVVADAKVTLGKLHGLLEGYKSEFGSTIKELKDEWLAERDRLSKVTFKRENFTPEIKDHFSQDILNEYADVLQTELPQTTALLAINETVDPDSVVICSAGSLPGDLQRLWHSNVPNTYHLEYGYSCMGYEVSGTLGLKLAHPDREVYSLVGDGSFLMLHSELITAIQYNKKLTCCSLTTQDSAASTICKWTTEAAATTVNSEQQTIRFSMSIMRKWPKAMERKPTKRTRLKN